MSHTYAVQYNVSSSSYAQLASTTTVYAVLCTLGWVFTNVNTYKYDNR